MSNYEIDGPPLCGTGCISTKDIHVNDAETICKNKMCEQNPSALDLIHSTNLLRNEADIKQFSYDNTGSDNIFLKILKLSNSANWNNDKISEDILETNREYGT